MLKDRDLQLFRATAVLGAAVSFASLIILIFWILAQVLSHFYSLLLPLAIAGVLALVLEPVVRILVERLKLRRAIAVVVLAAAISEKSGLHPAIVVISLFFWGIVFGGIIGMLLAVPLSAFLLALWKHAKAHYLSPVVTDADLILDSGTIKTAGSTDRESSE